MGGASSRRASPRQPSSVGSQSYSWNHQFPHASQAHESRRRLERKYSKIDDNYNSLEQVTEALSRAGLESSNLIVGMTSQRATSKRSFNRRSLHHIGDEQNPYEQAISIIGKTLSTFDEDNLIPSSTHDQEVFSFYSDENFCDGFEEVLSRYRELVPHLRLAGKKTVDAIVKASDYPLSIVLVGVGDGPWDMMREFDDNPARSFDNFQFVNFTEIISTRGKAIDRIPLPPPMYGAASFSGRKPSYSSSFDKLHPLCGTKYSSWLSSPPPPSYASDNHVCPICLTNPKDMAFGCGHQVMQDLELCPICRSTIQK
ncbi:hypothetical protein I3843_Q058400 [Carya illinoinensis]|nr:hypothetical protein I3843_Q058400 [Carya illinoinensis]